tara:strand:- start:5776 stop:5931 length:156 start_codon:yes stop_codon:yes gene_type:complete
MWATISPSLKLLFGLVLRARHISAGFSKKYTKSRPGNSGLIEVEILVAATD